MKILSFLKKFIKEEPRELEPENLNLNEIDSWIENKDQEFKTQDKNFLSQINQHKQELVANLKEKQVELEDFNLDEKKAEQRIKSIVQENFHNYLKYTSKLVEDLELLDIANSKELIEKLDTLFINFQKKSQSSFQKATFLVGEIGAIREQIDNFTKQLKTLINENKKLIDSTSIFAAIQNNNQELLEIKNSQKEIKKKIKLNKGKKDTHEIKVKDNQKNIDELKETNEYKEELKQKRAIDLKYNSLETEIYNLKKEINFKELANTYHKNEKEMIIIKDHKDNFLTAFEKDQGKKIAELVDKKAVNDKLQKISELKKEINEMENKLDLKKGVELSLKESEINKFQEDIKESNSEDNREKKLLEKAEISKQEVLDRLKKGFEMMNFNLIIPNEL